MRKEPLKILAITAGHDRICCVFAIGEQPMDWQMSFKATKSAKATKTKILEWIDYYQPDVVLTPLYSRSSHKGQRTRELVGIARQVAVQSSAQSIEIQPLQPFENKYQHVKYLCEKFPQLNAVSVRPRKYWEKESPRVSYFEAAGMTDNLNEK